MSWRTSCRCSQSLQGHHGPWACAGPCEALWPQLGADVVLASLLPLRPVCLGRLVRIGGGTSCKSGGNSWHHLGNLAPNWPLQQRVYHCRSAIQCLRHRPMGHVEGLRHAEHSAAAVSKVQQEAARMAAASTKTIAVFHHPPMRLEAKAAREAMVKGVYVHKLEDLCPVSLRRRVAPRPHTTCRGRGSGSGPPSCTRAWAICK